MDPRQAPLRAKITCQDCAPVSETSSQLPFLPSR